MSDERPQLVTASMAAAALADDKVSAREVRRWALTPVSTYRGAAVYDMAEVWERYTERTKARAASVSRAVAAGATRENR